MSTITIEKESTLLINDPTSKTTLYVGEYLQSINPAAIDNDTITATTIQGAFEQQETKTIYGGSF